jgi:hypothetical protein
VALYVIRVTGRLSDELLNAFPDLSITAERPLTTLCGQLENQAALHGVVSYLDMLGVEILEVIKVPASDREGREQQLS